MTGKLIVVKKKDVVSYRVEFMTVRGVVATASVSGTAKCFRDVDASDGMEVAIELKGGQPFKVTIPGKPEMEGQAVQRTAASPSFQRGGGRNTSAAERGPANTDACAPYNFISAQAPLGFSVEPDGSRFSGTICCSLTSLTPLLVCGPQPDRGSGVIERRFFEVAGVPTIPGASLKGMLRSVIEVLSCAPLGDGLSERKIAYRDVNSADRATPYGSRFRSGEEELCAGMLQEIGSERTIVPCSWMRFDGAQLDISDCDKRSAVDKYEALQEVEPLVQTVEFKDSDKTTDSGDRIGQLARGQTGALRGIPVFTGGLSGKKFLDYVFYGRRLDESLPVTSDVWGDFVDQLSPAQESLRKYFRKIDAVSIPVFFLRRKNTDGYKVTAIGLTRYFRIVAPKQPRDLAPKLAVGIGLPERMFGRVGNAGGTSIGGRLRFHAATPVGHGSGAMPASVGFPQDGNLVAGNPSATATSLYLEQNANAVQLRLGNMHQNEGLSTFASDTPVLRGRKLYWHRQRPSAPPPPNANVNVQAKYFPLAAQTKFSFSITFERLDKIELGALFEALELPAGAAHKLGLGKAFGLGSIRVDIDESQTVVQSDRDRYRHLRERFSPGRGGRQLLEACRKDFRDAITALRGGHDFEALTHVREFRVMTDFAKPRDPLSISYMKLKAPREVSYGMKPILRKPLEIPPASETANPSSLSNPSQPT